MLWFVGNSAHRPGNRSLEHNHIEIGYTTCRYICLEVGYPGVPTFQVCLFERPTHKVELFGNIFAPLYENVKTKKGNSATTFREPIITDWQKDFIIVFSLFSTQQWLNYDECHLKVTRCMETVDGIFDISTNNAVYYCNFCLKKFDGFSA